MAVRQPFAANRAESLCRYDHLENGIHKLTITHASRAATDEWSRHIEDIAGELTPSDPLVRILVVNSASHNLPLGYLSSKVRELLRRHPNPPRIRYATLLTNFGMVGLMNTLIRALHISNLTLRSFSVQHEAEAIAWLLADE